MINKSNYGQKGHWLHKEFTYKQQMHANQKIKEIFEKNLTKRINSDIKGVYDACLWGNKDINTNMGKDLKMRRKAHFQQIIFLIFLVFGGGCFSSNPRDIEAFIKPHEVIVTAERYLLQPPMKLKFTARRFQKSIFSGNEFVPTAR